MHWRLKAAIQNAVSRLPPATSYAAYYWLQRHFGELRRCNPMSRLSAGIGIWRRIQEQNRSPRDKTFFEVGTGRVPIVPMAYWLMGAASVVTIDLNPYLKRELIAECLRYMSDHEDDVRRLFGDLLVGDRFEMLLGFAERPGFSTSDVLDLCRITYIAPGDAADTALPGEAVDFHTSYTVLEHIPAALLGGILREGNRITKADGLFVHGIDYSDHFAHSDRGICAINFLRYADKAWQRYAGNRYMFMNRLRHDEFLELFEQAGHRLVAVDVDRDERAGQVLREGRFRLDERFASKTKAVLEITGAWLVTEKAEAAHEG